MHHVRTDVVRVLILKTLKATAGFVKKHVEEFISKVRNESKIQKEDATKALQKKLFREQKWNNELNQLIKKIYEDSYGFKPQKVVEIIAAYINNDRKLKRILYSEISNYIFALEYNEIATFSSNIGTLRDFALKSEDTMQEDYFERNMLNIQYSFDSTIKVNIYDDLLINFSDIANILNN